jgi:hypothetical protein
MSAAIDPADDDTDMWTAPAADRYDLPTFTSTGSQAWRADAACRGMDTAEVFFPARGQSVAPAMAICGGCPVQAECLTEAMVDPANSGIWGATSHRQRRDTRSASNPNHAPARKPIAHGTDAGYQAHQRRPGDPGPCDACREAYNTRHREAAARKRRNLARTITATHTDKAAA